MLLALNDAAAHALFFSWWSGEGKTGKWNSEYRSFLRNFPGITKTFFGFFFHILAFFRSWVTFLLRYSLLPVMKPIRAPFI